MRVADEKTLLIPDRRGNNRIDTLRNIIRDPRVALLFLIPGVGETIRINRPRHDLYRSGADARASSFDGKAPRSVIVVTVESIYFQCAKAIVRSKLWDASRHVDRKSLPSTGTILAAITQGKLGGAEYDRASRAAEGDALCRRRTRRTTQPSTATAVCAFWPSQPHAPVVRACAAAPAR